MKRRMRFQQRPTVKAKIYQSRYIAAGVAFAFIGGIIAFIYLNTNSESARAADEDVAWHMNFGTGTGTHTSGTSTTFLPKVTSGTARVSAPSEKKEAGYFSLQNPGLSNLGSGTEIKALAAAENTPAKFSLHDYTPGKSFYLKYTFECDEAKEGEWYFFIGDGSTFSDDNLFNESQIFTGFQITYNKKDKVNIGYRKDKSWSVFPGLTLGIQPNSAYTVEIYGNNTTKTINYNYASTNSSCSLQSVEPNKFDVYISGVLIGNDLTKSGLANDSNIDSYMFYGNNSKKNDAALYLDDFTYSNSIPTSLLPPAAQPTAIEITSVSTTSVKVSYSAADGTPDGYLVLRKAGSAPTSSPVDFTEYKVGSAIGDATVAYLGTGTTFTETALTSGTEYFYKIYSFEGKDKCANYLNASPLSGSQYTYYTEDEAAFKSLQTGTWTTSTAWQYEYLPGKFKNASKAPTSKNKSISILSNHKLTSSTLITDNVTVEENGSLIVNGDLTINNGNPTIDFSNAGTITISGNLKVLGKMEHKTTSKIEFNGKSTQTIPAGTYYTVVVSNGGVKTLQGDIIINKSLELKTTVLNTQNYTLTLAADASLSGESSTNYISGKLKIVKTVSSSKETFAGMGITIDATANSQNLGNVTLIRSTGTPIYVGKSSSISRNWSIEPEFQPKKEVSLTLNWEAGDESVPFDLTRMQVWKSSDKGKTWVAVGAVQNASTRSITVKTGSFSDWTASDANNMLPVKFRTYTAKENIDGSASLKWITTEEINNEGFEIEKSADGKIFEKIGFVNGSGNASSDKSYEFSDNMFNASAYYRLKQVDFNGQSEYSSIIHLDKKGISAQKPFTISPNPIKDHATISSTYTDIDGKNLEVVIFSAKGKEMMRKTGTLDEINEDLNNTVGPWDEGMYIIDIRFNGKVERLKVVKDRF